MRSLSTCLSLAAGAALIVCLAAPSPAAIRVRQPLLEETPAGAAAPAGRPSDEAFFVGSVIFARGAQVVAEVPGGAQERERLVVFDGGMRRRGVAVVLAALDKGVFLLQPQGGIGASPGDQLARESETEAAARVVQEHRAESYLEFLEFFPRSEYRSRVGRELFRLAMKQGYPTFPGSVVEGRITLAEGVGREIPLGQVFVLLDRFVVARTDERGRFRIEGIPKLDEAVALRLRVRDAKFQLSQEVTVELSAGSFQEAAAELPVRITPTVLAGQVLDERGAPLPGAEVWTAPYSMEVLTDAEGMFRISRRKRVDATGAALAGDEPLFGGEFEVYAYRKGYGVDRVTISAESYAENSVPAVRLLRQDAREEEIPALGLTLRSYLEMGPTALAAPQGAGPKLNP
ncbi:MAG: hypothetical protein AB1578_10890 [Thermodesulfobacteriota bacterium]